jgi:hypothetical protein
MRGQKKSIRKQRLRPFPLSIDKILAWADEHHERTGKWPNAKSGRVWLDASATWNAVNCDLNMGYRGLPGGFSLADLLLKHREVRSQGALPGLSIEQILAWADAYRGRTGKWPSLYSGVIEGSNGETWKGIDHTLRDGRRGLPGGSSLAKLLAEHRGVRNIWTIPRLTIKRILKWADAHHQRTGRWPRATSGAVEGAHGETWKGVHESLRFGYRGLPGGSSLARLLAEHRGVRNIGSLPALTVEQILDWADAHYRRTGRWPIATSGPVEGSSGETWRGVHEALRHGYRGLPGGTTLARLLSKHHGVRNKRAAPSLTIRQIVAWADAHYARTGRWPNSVSGPVADAPGETWWAINCALNSGGRGLPRGPSLNAVLAEHRGVPRKLRLPRLSTQKILRWARAYRRRTGKWPSVASGPINGKSGPCWRALDLALRRGYNGLRGGSSLQQLLIQKEGRRRRAAVSRLTAEQVLAWAKSHYRRTGEWPNKLSGEIDDALGETWAAIHAALSFGHRGLSGGTSLRRFLAEHGCAETRGTAQALQEAHGGFGGASVGRSKRNLLDATVS